MERLVSRDTAKTWVRVLKPTMQEKESVQRREEKITALSQMVEELRLNSRVKKMVEKRIEEFREAGKEGEERWFEELTYCLLTAYSSAQMGMKCIDALSGEDILIHGELDQVRACLLKQGHRFAPTRSVYILDARRYFGKLKEIITSHPDSQSARQWLVDNIKGLGMKEASHFLRNVGNFDLAIIDRHILAHLREHGLATEVPSKSLTKKRYLDYEKALKEVANVIGMPVGEMDLYLWYKKTGAVMK